MRKTFLMIILLLNSFTSFAQRVDNMWLQGYENWGSLPFGGTNLDFNYGAPVISYDSLRIMSLDFTCGIICDSAGQSRFYTNGIWIADASNDTMLNGSGLNPSSYTTANVDYGIRLTGADMVLPNPGDSNQYYLIHHTPDDIDYPYPSYMYYTLIDMSLNNGLGAVIAKNQIIISDTLELGQLEACKHANGRDWWIVFPERNTTYYYVYLLSQSGFSFQSKQAIRPMLGSTGQASFSPDGNTFASYDTYVDLAVFDFDRCSGYFSNAQHISINDSMSGLGLSFSPDSRKIYASATLYLYQFDLDSLNLANYSTVAVWDSTYSPNPPLATFFFTQYLRPDGKIYINTGNGTFKMHTIDFPDSAGMACQVSQHSVTLPTFYSSTCPTYINYYLGPVVGSVCDSLSVGLNAPGGGVNLNVSINPNPAKEQFYVGYSLPGNKDGWLDLSDASGRVIVHRRLYWSNKSLLLYTNELTSGCYFVKVTSDVGATQTKRLMVLK